jgi:hypothetical protein
MKSERSGEETGDLPPYEKPPEREIIVVGQLSDDDVALI